MFVGIYIIEDAAGIPEVTKYYSIAGQRVALNGPDGLQFLLTDHLGSVVGITDASGDLLGEQRYMPFAEERLSPGISETDFGFTGQIDLAAIGLMDYNARFYDPGLGRFTQADIIVSQPFWTQSLNRYSYVENSPINFMDPSGYALCASLDGSCTANYVQPTSAPNPLTSTAGAKRPRYCQIRPENCNKGGYQDINKGITADLAASTEQPTQDLCTVKECISDLMDFVSSGLDVYKGTTGANVPGWMGVVLQFSGEMLRDPSLSFNQRFWRAAVVGVEGVGISYFALQVSAGGCIVGGGPASPQCYVVGGLAGLTLSKWMTDQARIYNENVFFPAIDESDRNPYIPSQDSWQYKCGNMYYGYTICQ